MSEAILSVLEILGVVIVAGAGFVFCCAAFCMAHGKHNEEARQRGRG